MLLPLLGGLLLGSARWCGQFPLEAAAITAALLFMVMTRWSLLVRSYRLRWWSGVHALMVWLLLGMAYGQQEAVHRLGKVPLSHYSPEVWEGSVLLKVLSPAIPGAGGANGGYSSMACRIMSTNSHRNAPVGDGWANPEAGRRLAIRAKGLDSLIPGSLLMAGLMISKPVHRAHPVEFDRATYLASQGIYLEARLEPEHWRLVKTGCGLRALVDRIRRHSLSSLDNAVPDPETRALLAAVSLGWKSEVDKETLQAFSKAGTLHILAVSGMHVGLVYLLIQRVLNFVSPDLRRSRKIRLLQFFIATGGVWFFTLLCGSAPSALRAAFLFSMMALGNLAQRKSGGRNAWAGTALVLLSIQPFLLRSVGFQLSFAAVAGILWVYPAIRQRICWGGFFGKHLADLMALSLAAQLGSLPASWHYFSVFPTHFLLGNLVGVPLVGFFLAGCVVLFCLSGILPVGMLGSILSFSIELWFKAMNQVGELPMAVIGLYPLPALSAVLLFSAILLYFSGSSGNFSTVAQRTSAAGMLILGLSWMLYRGECRSAESRLIVTGYRSQIQVEAVAGSQAVLLLGNSYTASRASIRRGVRPRKASSGAVTNIDPEACIGHPEHGLLPVVLNDCPVVWFNGEDQTIIPRSGIVFVAGGNPPEDSTESGNPGLRFALCPELSKRQRQLWLSWCRENRIDVSLIPDYGTREYPLSGQ